MMYLPMRERGHEGGHEEGHEGGHEGGEERGREERGGTLSGCTFEYYARVMSRLAERLFLIVP